ncbi:MarR family transcriptional regulator [Sphaerisporangium rubeum]|uniref:DNA-binding MarR family transcriptional regulator n=1 Tax=Sphaerisporangium rubeum TaxID=321317 RepID=A0A7X0I954_9ACTN|nr:DNA-binding MarR family transcriptional regulator [Sphaerisporangium rubeum]
MDDTTLLARDLRVAVGRVARRMRQLYATPASAGGTTFTELAVLSRLYREGPTTPGTLAAGERVTAQAIAPVLTALERRALVDRTPDTGDRRRVIVTLTEAGRTLLETREQAVMAELIRTLATFDDAERRNVLAAIPLLERLADNL